MVVDLSVLISVRGSLRGSHPALRSVFRSIEDARQRGARTTELLLLISSGRPAAEIAAETEYLREHFGDGARLFVCSATDRGQQWREGAQAASGRLVCLLDSRDYVGTTWFEAAWRCAERAGAAAVLHPAFVLEFGDLQRLRRHRSSTDPEFRWDDLLVGPAWHSLLVAPREVLLRHPFGPTDSRDGFGAGDWDFACATLAAGVQHLVVPDTVCFVRRTHQVDGEPRGGERIARPSPLFDVEPEQARAAPRSPARKGRLVGRLFGWLYRCVKSVALRHPRWNRLGVQIADAFRDFFGAGAKAQGVLPAWLVDDWRRIHEVEPELFPGEADLRALHLEEATPSNIAPIYRALRGKIGPGVSHVLLVPWIRQGGADLTALNYVRALAELGTPGRIVLVCTEDSASVWRDRVPPQVQLVERPTQGLSPAESEMLLARLLLQMHPRVIHNVNSRLAWQVFTRFGAALRQESLLFGSTFCTDIEESGRAVGYPVTHLRHSFQHLSAAFTDCAAHAEEFVQRFAFDRARLLVHYQPVPHGLDHQPPTSRPAAGAGPLQVLWAGRIDRQKRPDILAAIARACGDVAVQFHVYGSAVLDSGHHAQLSDIPNLTVHGSYDGFASLPLERFDLYLYTSEWDGLPNVMMESAAVGLPILAPAVGGIPEIVRDGETGFLVPSFDDVAAYASRIASIARDRGQLVAIAARARELVVERHSWPAFLRRVRDVPGYLQ